MGGVQEGRPQPEGLSGSGAPQDAPKRRKMVRQTDVPPMAPPGKRAAPGTAASQRPPAHHAGTFIRDSHKCMQQPQTKSDANTPAAGSSAARRPADTRRTSNRPQQAPGHAPPVGPINNASAAADGQPQGVTAPRVVLCERRDAAVSSLDATRASPSLSGQLRHAPAAAAMPGGRDRQHISSSSNHAPSAPAPGPAASSVSTQPMAVPMHGVSVESHDASHANGASPVRAAADEARAKVMPKITWSNPLKRMPLAMKNSPGKIAASDAGVEAEPGSPSGVVPMDIDSPAQQQPILHAHQGGSAPQVGNDKPSGQAAAAPAAAQPDVPADAAPAISAERDPPSTKPAQPSQHQPRSGSAEAAPQSDADGSEQGAHQASGRRDWEWGVPVADARHVRRVKRQAKAPSVKLEADAVRASEGTGYQGNPLPVLPDKLKIPSQSRQDSAPAGKGVKRKAESEPEDVIIDLTSSSEKEDASDGEDDPASPNDAAPSRTFVTGVPLKQNRGPAGPVRKAMRMAQLEAQCHATSASHNGPHAAQHSQPPASAPANGQAVPGSMPPAQNAGMQQDQQRSNGPRKDLQQLGRISHSKIPQQSWNAGRPPNAAAYTASIRPMSWHQQAENGHRFAHSGLAGSSRPVQKASSPLRRPHTAASMPAGPLQKKQRMAAPGQGSGQTSSKQTAGASGFHQASKTVESGGVMHTGSNAQPDPKAAAARNQHSRPHGPLGMANGSTASHGRPVAQQPRPDPTAKAPGLSPLARQLSARHGTAPSEVSAHLRIDLMGQQMSRQSLLHLQQMSTFLGPGLVSPLLYMVVFSTRHPLVTRSCQGIAWSPATFNVMHQHQTCRRYGGMANGALTDSDWRMFSS